MPSITPNLWFDGNGEEAATFYTSVFPNSAIGAVTHYPADSPGAEGSVMTVSFTLDGKEFVAINGGPQFPFTEAISLEIRCQDQAEIDYYWETLAEGGQESQCGWLKDKFGVSWQVVPQAWMDLFTDPDQAKVQRVTSAMLKMVKFDIAELERAAAGA